MNKVEKNREFDQCNDAHEHAICPMVLVQRILSGKRKILILWYLSHQVLRFSELKRDLPDVTQKMLTLQLRSLEEDKLIYRKVYPVIPPRVEYGLTEVGKRIIPILEMMHAFGEKYLQAGLYEKSEKNNETKKIMKE